MQKLPEGLGISQTTLVTALKQLLPSVKALWIFISRNLYLSKPAHMPGQQSLTPGEVFGWNSRRRHPGTARPQPGLVMLPSALTNLASSLTF